MKRAVPVSRFRSLQKRERLRTRDLEDMFWFLEEMREYVASELEERKKEKDEAVDKEKKKGGDNFFTKKFSFTSLLFANLVSGPIIGLIIFVLIWTRFH